MKTLTFGIVAVSVVAGLLLVEGASSGGGQAPKIRQPAVAGSFYPADPKELAGMLDGFLAKAAPPPLENVVALVAPQAGCPSVEVCVGGGAAARGLSLFGSGGRVLLCVIEGPEIRPRGGDCTLALRSLRFLIGV